MPDERDEPLNDKPDMELRMFHLERRVQKLEKELATHKAAFLRVQDMDNSIIDNLSDTIRQGAEHIKLIEDFIWPNKKRDVNRLFDLLGGEGEISKGPNPLDQRNSKPPTQKKPKEDPDDLSSGESKKN